MDKSEEKHRGLSQKTENRNKKLKITNYIFLIYIFVLTGLFIYLKLAQKYILALFISLLILSLVIKSYISIVKQRKRLNLNYIGIAFLTLAILLMLFMPILCYLSIDTAPVPKDYLFDDIRSAAPEYNETFKLLNSLDDRQSHLDILETSALSGDINAIEEIENEYGKNYLKLLKYTKSPGKNPPIIILSREDINNIGELSILFRGDNLQTISQRLLKNEEIILSTWQNAKNGRDIFAKLDTYVEIADLTEPKYQDEFPWERF